MGTKTRFLFFGKVERALLIILALLATSGLLLMGREPSEPPRQTVSPAGDESDTIYRTPDYAGPPEHLRQQSANPKLKPGTTVDINAADSTLLTRIPGIGPAFSRRIVRLRERLGGFYTVLQLQEVYGIDEDKFLELRSWFRVKTPPKTYRLEELNADALPNHPYLSYQHKRTLRRLIQRNGVIKRWSTLMRDASFTRDDSIRLSHYFLESSKDTISK